MAVRKCAGGECVRFYFSTISWTSVKRRRGTVEDDANRSGGGGETALGGACGDGGVRD